MSRERLREWVASTGHVAPADLADDTPLLESRIISSLQVMEMILFIEALAGRPIDLERLTPGRFRDIDTICRSFLEP